MKTTKYLAATLGLVLAATGLAGCGGDSDNASGADGSTRVRLAFTPGATTLPVHLAITRGIFKAHGLDVQETEGLDLPTWAAGLGKQWDVAMGTPGIFVAGADKLDLDVIAGGQVTTDGSVTGNPLIVRDADISSAADLIGKRVGVATLTGSTATAISYLVQQAGGKADDVKLVQVPFDAQADQLKAGAVDAIVSALPFSVPILQDPANTALFDIQDVALRDIDPDQPVMASILYQARASWVDDNKDAAEEFQDSLTEAQEWMNDHKDEALAEMGKWLKLDPSVTSDMPWPIPVEARITPESLQPSIDMYVKAGAVSEADAPKLTDRFPLATTSSPSS